ncbi:MAG: hypothetical protein U1F68_06040 [Gammaproteobacteria bacterium]
MELPNRAVVAPIARHFQDRLAAVQHAGIAQVPNLADRAVLQAELALEPQIATTQVDLRISECHATAGGYVQVGGAADAAVCREER